MIQIVFGVNRLTSFTWTNAPTGYTTDEQLINESDGFGIAGGYKDVTRTEDPGPFVVSGSSTNCDALSVVIRTEIEFGDCHWEIFNRCCVASDSITTGGGGGVAPGGVTTHSIDHTDSPYTAGANAEDLLLVDASGGDVTVVLNNSYIGLIDIKVTGDSSGYATTLDPFGS